MPAESSAVNSNWSLKKDIRKGIALLAPTVRVLFILGAVNPPRLFGQEIEDEEGEGSAVTV